MYNVKCGAAIRVEAISIRLEGISRERFESLPLRCDFLEQTFAGAVEREELHLPGVLTLHHLCCTCAQTSDSLLTPPHVHDMFLNVCSYGEREDILQCGKGTSGH